MYPILFLFSSFLMYGNLLIFDFSKDSDLTNWTVVDDIVMGGRSDGALEINDSGYGLFHGRVSLENNGGFSSVRYRLNQIDITGYTKLILRLRGDGKRYQFRVKTNSYDRHSYIYYFETTHDWQTIEIPLSAMKAAFRGRFLDMPNFQGKLLEEVAILIGNNESEDFKLEIDKISLE